MSASPLVRDQLTAALGPSFTIERELTGGSMATVFLARDANLDRRIVVKVVSPQFVSPLSIERFQREIQILARLQHPNIVPVLTAGTLDGVPYFTMPYVQGESLRARLERDKSIDQSDAIRILRDVAAALAYAHGEGVVHRDIKPDNVLMSGASAMVTDFGIAKAISNAKQGGAERLTVEGSSLGTPAYMAPEQILDEPVDHRADLYAFGMMAYELMTGATPFAGRSALAMVAAHAHEKVRPITDVTRSIGAALAELIMSCVEKDPSRRPQTAADVVRRLEGMAVPKSPARGWLLRHRRSRIAILTAVPTLAVAVVVFGTFQMQRLPPGLPLPSGTTADSSAPLQPHVAPAPATLDSVAMRNAIAVRVRDSLRIAASVRKRVADSIRLATAARQSTPMIAASARPMADAKAAELPAAGTIRVAQGTIRIASSTPSAVLYVNDKLDGVLGPPRDIVLPMGTVKLSVRAVNCASWDTTVLVGNGAVVIIGRRNARC